MWSSLSGEGGGSRWDRVQREFTQFCLKHLRKDKFLATHFTVCHLQESSLKGNMNSKKAHTYRTENLPAQKTKKTNKVPCFCFFEFASLEVAEVLLVHKLALDCSWV